MSQPVDDLYFLADQDGMIYYNNNGIVAKGSTAIPLPDGPDGWLTKSIKWARNPTYFGLFRSFTSTLNFVGFGAKVIRTRWFSQGCEDKIYMSIYKLSKTFGGGWVHKFFYKGELDLTQCDDGETSIGVNIMEGNLTKIFTANVAKPYDIIIDGPLVKDDGILLFETAQYTVIDGTNINFGVDGSRGLRRPWPLIKTSQEGTSAGISFTNQENVFPTNGQFFGENTTDVTSPVTINVKLKGSVTLVCTEGTGATINVFFTNDITTLAAFISIGVITATAGTTYVIPFDLTVPVGFAQKLTVQMFQTAFGSGANTTFQFLPDSTFSASFSNRFEPTYTKTMKLVDLGQALLDKMAGGPGYTFESDLLSTEWDNLVVTSGDAIRRIDGSVIKTSMADFLKSVNTVANISSKIIDNVLKVEGKSAAFSSAFMPSIGEVTKFKRKPATDHMFAGVKIGYPDLDTHAFQSLNAKEEFNVTSNFSSPQLRTANILDLLSVYKASMYEQELARINLDGLKTTSDGNDNSVFFKHLNRIPVLDPGGIVPEYYVYFRDTYDSVTGLIDPASAYNMAISPKNCLFRHGNYLRSCFYWEQGGKLTFDTSDRNSSVITVKGGVTVSEAKDENIGSLADTFLFIPIIFTIDSPMPNEQPETMATMPEATLPFLYNGKQLYGFVNELSIQPASKAVQTTTLLCSPLVDPSILININNGN